MKTLKIGDVVFGEYQLVGIRKYVIDRVTKTRAFAKEQGFNIDFSDTGRIDPYPRDTGYHTWSYRISNKEGELKYEKQRIVWRIAQVKMDSLCIEKLRAIKAILENVK